MAHIFSPDANSDEKFRQINEIGTANVASAAATAGVGHLILISSVSVYDPYTHEDVYDTHRFEEAYSFQTKTSLEDGLKREVDWYRRDKGDD